MENIVLKLDRVSKKFKTDFWKKPIEALKNISFEVKKGATFGLVGPNGAGKTTAIKMMLGLIEPTSGHLSLFGNQNISDPRVRGKIGYLPESAYYYDYLYPEEILNFYAKLFGVKKSVRAQRIESLLKLVGLWERKDRKLKSFSKGMLQRIGIAQALINDPEVVILDEPMSGLDPSGRKEIKDIIVALQKSGKTIIFSSHILVDVEQLCDDVAIIMGGELRTVGALSDLVGLKTLSIEMQFRAMDPQPYFSDFKSISVRQVGQDWMLEITDEALLPKILEDAHKNHLKLISLQQHKESLEKVYENELIKMEAAKT